MQINRATEADSDELIHFLSGQPFLSGPPVDLLIERTGSFFDKFRMQSNDFDTFIIRDYQGKITGTASVVYRTGLINGTPTILAFGSDLRIANDREAIIEWRKLFFPKFKESLEKRNCKMAFATVNFSQGSALNSLIRPRNPRRDTPRFFLLRKFDFVSLHGRSPFIQGNPLNTVKIFEGEANDLEPLVNYLNKKSRNILFAFPYTVELMQERFKSWSGLSLDNFLIAKDVRGNIVGCCAPWKSRSQYINVTKYSGIGTSFKNLMRAGSLLGFVKSLPSVGHHLNMKYLTHLQADNPDIFRRMLKTALRRTVKDEFLAYINFERDPLKLPPRVFVTSTIPFALYSVLPPGMPLPSYLYPNTFVPAPELEPNLI